MSVVRGIAGYDEENYIYIGQHDKFNKVPKFCSKCGKPLKSLDKPEDSFDVYTGKPVAGSYLVCPAMSAAHDIWKEEGYGAWVKY